MDRKKDIEEKKAEEKVIPQSISIESTLPGPNRSTSLKRPCISLLRPLYQVPIGLPP